MKLDRIRELAAQLPAGAWHYERGTDGALLLYAGGEPIAHVYGGIDLAKYLVEVAPAVLLDEAAAYVDERPYLVDLPPAPLGGPHGET